MTLADGVYINLPDTEYFAQDRLGSTDLKTLHADPASWWYGSAHNPDRPGREHSDEMSFGSALHVLVLEGDVAFEGRCEISPFEDFRTKEARVWRDERRLAGQIILTEDMARRVRHMAELILNHPELGEPLGKGLSEVTVFWTEGGLKLRARFDKLLPRFVVDLKTFGGDAKGTTAKQQCLNLVAGRSMDVQRFLYFKARQQMAGLIEAGALHGGSEAERDWIAKVAAVEDWEWCWIFYRRRDDAKGYAPVVKPIVRRHLDATFDTGRRKVEVALANYRAFRDRFGFKVPWAVIEAAEEPADHEFPPWLAQVHEPTTFPETEKAAA